MPGDHYRQNPMESEKKPKRPRINTMGTQSQSDNGESENRYEKVNYGSGNYQPRQNYGYPRQGGYQPRQNSYNGYGRQPYQQKTSDYPKSNLDSSESTDQSADTSASVSDFNSTEQQTGYQRPNNGYQRMNNGYQRYQRPNQGYQRQNNGYQRQNNGYQRQYNQAGGDETGAQGYAPQNNGYQRPNNGYQRQNNGYNRPNNGYSRPNNGYGRQNNNYQRQGGYQQRTQGGYNRPQNGYNRQGYQNGEGGYQQGRRQINNFRKQQGGMKFTPRPRQIDYVLDDIDPNEQLRLNKYMANAGICSRREADEFIQAGKVKVNGEVVTELGTKITRNDVVEYEDKVVTPERKCYVLLNKPKDCVTTSDDPNGRLTVLDLVKNACQERIYPVGRLDRNTTGVLLLTNDGDLASKLTHPKFVKKKIYHVWTDKDITEEDMQRIADGIELEDGEIHADAISYVSDTEHNQAGIEIHSGRNRIVRRIFESLGYRVTKLDRVYFAGLTKKNLPRGRWRYLTQEEVNYLRMGAFE